jgi:hypothetical protein
MEVPRRDGRATAAMTLFETLPELLADIDRALLNLGRGDVVDQLHAARLVSWSYDDFAELTFLHLSDAASAGSGSHQSLSLFDDIGVNLEMDAQGRVSTIEVAGYEDILARLKSP